MSPRKLVHCLVLGRAIAGGTKYLAGYYPRRQAWIAAWRDTRRMR